MGLAKSSSPENFGRSSLRREGVGVVDETWELEPDE